MKTTTYENKIARVTCTPNDKRTIEIFPDDMYVSIDCEDQYLFVCSTVELKKSSLALQVNAYQEVTIIDEIFQDENEAMKYFKQEELFYNKHNRTYKAKGELTRTLNTQIIYPMNTIRSILVHHRAMEQTFTRN